MSDHNQPARLVSLDQFRGYTVVGMFLVNYLGSFSVCPHILRHTHDYVSYADTIMPQFLFAVGFAMRLSMTRKSQAHEPSQLRIRMLKRLLGLVLVSLVVYTVGTRAESWQRLTELGFWGAISEPLKRTWFQTLMHIAVTSLWIMPVIQAGAIPRTLWLIGSAAAHVWLSGWFNFEWVNTSPNAIDGGPLGFLTWTIPALAGTLACDLFSQTVVDPHLHGPSEGPSLSVVRSTDAPRGTARVKSAAVFWSLGAATVLMLLGYGISCGTRFYDVLPGHNSEAPDAKLADSPVWPSAQRVQAKRATAQDYTSYLAEPPFIPPPSIQERKWNYWMMSQRGGTLSYLVFCAGFSWAVFLVFYFLCDVWKLESPFFRTFGTNALLAYVLHGLVGSAVKPFVPKDAPAWYAVASLLVFFTITWVFVRYFEKNKYFVRV